MTSTLHLPSLMPANCSPAKTTETSPLIDYRCPQDDAWYNVRLQLRGGDKLRIMFCDFSEGCDELYGADAFDDEESLEAFLHRFRSRSLQLQDRGCDRVVKGILVCASCHLAKDEVRFYDALVLSVNPSIHSLQEGDCRCRFELLWQHGPLNGQKALAGIEHICLLQPQGTNTNLTLKKFIDIVKGKLKIKVHASEPKPIHCASDVAQNSIPESARDVSTPSTTSHCSEYMPGCTTKRSKEQHHLASNSLDTRYSKVKHKLKNSGRGRNSGEDVSEGDFDMGGESLHHEILKKKASCYFFTIDNMEKDLSPFKLMQFIHEYLGIPCSTFVCPSAAHEFCTRGFILVDKKVHASKIMDFLLNTEYIIVSSRGRLPPLYSHLHQHIFYTALQAKRIKLGEKILVPKKN
ncbi:hypothetical protein AXF42_Ash004415 [Apostasia shenzhenica]|uniref:SAWADEE domain-containing protein n=1 Tax=Apostasia shenzhenica TaxID=1088818 RepID=A0A2I0A2X6_9ASPA|nr:hypothetical protein AXF42_Ash004415 [Apostasia shenzhenica]